MRNKICQKLRCHLHRIGWFIILWLPITVGAVTVQIDLPLDQAVIKTDNTLVTGIANALGGAKAFDLALVFDDSGSLSSSDPTRERFEATRQLLSSFGPLANIHIGVTFFTTSASVAVPLQSVSTARTAINATILSHQNPGGGTAIGEGIRAGIQELDANGRANSSKVILVFTDGWDSASQAKEAAANACHKGYVLHILALPSVEEAFAQEIAQAGCGQYFLATRPTDLIPLFRGADLVRIADVSVTNQTTGVPANSVSLSTGNFTAPIDLIIGQNVLQSVATDRNGATATDSVTVKVEPPEMNCLGGRMPICPTQTPSSCQCPPTIRTKLRPQVLMAGFDPILLDFGSGNIIFKVKAIIREGASPIRHVVFKENTEAHSRLGGMRMTSEGQLENGDKVYSFEYLLDSRTASTLMGKPLPNLFGSGIGEYHLIVIDESQQMHAFPDLNIGNNPDLFIDPRPQIQAYTTKGISRYGPQVLMVGMDPMVLDFGDDSFKIKALVRAGNVPIQSVVLKNGNGSFNYTLFPEGNIGNGDTMYSLEYTFKRGTFPAGSLRDLFGTQNPLSEYVVEAIDQAGQTHAFPAFEVCNCPEYKKP